MDTLDLFNIFGSAAAICMIFGYLPQAIHTIRTRETDAIAMPTFLLMGLGSIFFVLQGFASDPFNIPLITTNLITAVCAAVVFGIKIHNDYFKKKRK
jgi:MtN3 and saliva related transmembrane protein